MKLSEAIAQEARTFINPDELGEPILLDGLAVTGVITQPHLTVGHGMDMDVPRMERTLHVVTTDLPEGFTHSGILDYQGEIWSVVGSSVSGGITRFELVKTL